MQELDSNWIPRGCALRIQFAKHRREESNQSPILTYDLFSFRCFVVFVGRMAIIANSLGGSIAFWDVATHTRIGEMAMPGDDP